MKRTKEGYKRTAIGLIPNDWEVLNISTIARITTGSKNTQDKVDDGDYPFFVRSQTIERINTFSYDCEGVLTAGDGVGTGKVFHYINGKFDLHQRVYLIHDFSKKRLNGRFFFFYFSHTFFDRMSQMTAKSSVDSVRREMIADMNIPIPLLSEQIKISEILTDVNDLINSLELSISKKKHLKQGAMQALLSPKDANGNLKKEWVNVELQEIVKQFIVPMRDKPKRFSGDIPWCRIEDFDGKYLFTSKSDRFVDNKTISEMNLKLMPVETLIVSCSADLGRCAIIKKPLVTNQTFIGLVVDDSCASNEFLYYYFTFNADRLNQLSSGTTISYLSREQFESLKITVPSSKSEQTRIAAILTDMDAEISALEAKVDKYKSVKQGMMQQLLTGKIRLV